LPLVVRVIPQLLGKVTVLLEPHDIALYTAVYWLGVPVEVDVDEEAVPPLPHPSKIADPTAITILEIRRPEHPAALPCAFIRSPPPCFLRAKTRLGHAQITRQPFFPRRASCKI
jgi:hypothetical protein